MKKFARVKENLELLVNENFVVDGTMVKILTTLKSPCAKHLSLLLKGSICPNVLAIFFFIISLVEDMKAVKSKCPIQNTFFFCCAWDTKSLKLSCLQ